MERQLVKAPKEAVEKILSETLREYPNINAPFLAVLRFAINSSYIKGADTELEACCEWLEDKEFCDPYTYKMLQEARRPKHPSLKEMALAALAAIASGVNDTREQYQDIDTILQALHSIPEET